MPQTITNPGGVWQGTGLTGALSVVAADSSAVGYLLVACIAIDNSGGGGAAPTIGLTDSHTSWTIVGPANRDPGAANAGATCYIAYGFVASTYAAGSDTINVTSTPSSTLASVQIYQFSGVNSTPVAVSVVTATGGSTAPAVSITPTAAGQLVFAACAFEGNSTDRTAYDTDTTNGSWSGNLTQQAGSDVTATNNMTAVDQFKIVTASGAQAWGLTLGTSRDWACCIIVFAPAPLTNTQSVGGGMTPSGTIAKQNAKPLAGGMTPQGAVAKQQGKPLGGAMTPAGLLVKLDLKPLAGGLTPTGVPGPVKVGTPNPKSVAGGMTPSGAAPKIVAKPLSGAFT